MGALVARILVALLIAWGACAPAAEQAHLVAELDANSFLETYSPEVSVSGTVIVGVSSSNALDGAATKSLAVIARPDRGEREVCLTMISRDGAYYSRSVFRLDLPADSGGTPLWLPYDKSTRRDILDKYRDTEIAMLATPGNCEHFDQTYYVVDTRDAGAARFVRIYVNSFGATDVYYQIGDNSEEVACNLINAGQRTSFDYWCDLPQDQIGGSPKVRILRERFGRELPTVKLTLLTAPGA